MPIMRLALSAVVITAALFRAEARHVAETNKQLEKNEGDFWTRFLQYNTMSLPPTLSPILQTTPPPPPTPVPTAKPTAFPTPPLTPAPTRAPTAPPTSAPTPGPTVQSTPPPSTAPTAPPTAFPTQQPTPAPTLAPTAPPTPAPTPGPTPTPIPPPSQAPTALSKPLPTPAPTMLPTPIPTSPATPSPTSAPTSAPTPLSPQPTPEQLTPSPVTPLPTLPSPPSLQPTRPTTSSPTTSAPTSTRTSAPTPRSPQPTPEQLTPSPVTPLPSLLPTTPPTAPPTAPLTLRPTLPPTTPNYACLLDLNLYCQPPEGASSCNTIPPLVTQCLQRPTEITMLLYGGNCSQSFNIQPTTLFRCSDFGTNNGPPKTQGSKVFVVATDIKGQGIAYFSGYVNIGDTYTLSNKGSQVDTDINITIYASKDLSPSNILETLVYQSSCSHNLFLGDRFGASQLVQFVNNAQGVVSLFAKATFDFSVKLPLTLMGTATLTSLVSITNIGVFNFTDQVFGINISAGQEIVVSQPIALDLTRRRRYTILTTLTGVSSFGQNCSASSSTSFIAGNPAPPGFPTLAPTGASSGTLAPTTNPLTTPCRLRTAVFCTVPNREAPTCDSLTGPSVTSCSGNASPSFLQFRYNGGLGVQVFISIVQGPEPAFKGVVSNNSFINAYGNFNSNGVPVVISSVVNGAPGQQLASFGVPTTCDGKSLLLYSTYGGALQLSSFANSANGLVSGFATVQLDYALLNDGDRPVVATTAVAVSNFSNTNSLISSPISIPGNGQVDLGNETAVINLLAAKNAGITFSFKLNATGKASGSGNPCLDSVQYQFTVK